MLTCTHKMSVCNEKKEGEVQSSRRLKTICVFGGSNLGNDARFAGAAMELGRTVAERKISLLYEGGSTGIRACAASAAFIRGSRVGGVTLKHVAESNVLGSTLGSELRVSNVHDRMVQMLVYADAFIALPGGLGTLEEVFNILSWGKLNIHQKPLGLLNTNGFYNGLLSFLDHAVSQGLITQATENFLFSAPNANLLIDRLHTFVPKPDPLMKQVKWYNEDNSKEHEPNTTLKL